MGHTDVAREFPNGLRECEENKRTESKNYSRRKSDYASVPLDRGDQSERRATDPGEVSDLPAQERPGVTPDSVSERSAIPFRAVRIASRKLQCAAFSGVRYRCAGPE